MHQASAPARRSRAQEPERTENEELAGTETGTWRVMWRCITTAWILAGPLIKSCSFRRNNLKAPRRRIPSAESRRGAGPNPVRMSRPWFVPDWRVPRYLGVVHDCGRFRLPRRLIRAASSSLTLPPHRSAPSSPTEGTLIPSGLQVHVKDSHRTPTSTLRRCHA